VSHVRTRSHTADETLGLNPKRAKPAAPPQTRQNNLPDVDEELHLREAELQRKERARFMAILEESQRKSQAQANRRPPESDSAAGGRLEEPLAQGTVLGSPQGAAGKLTGDLGTETGISGSPQPRMQVAHSWTKVRVLSTFRPILPIVVESFWC
jgi:hypothetical protein